MFSYHYVDVYQHKKIMLMFLSAINKSINLQLVRCSIAKKSWYLHNLKQHNLTFFILFYFKVGKHYKKYVIFNWVRLKFILKIPNIFFPLAKYLSSNGMGLFLIFMYFTITLERFQNNKITPQELRTTSYKELQLLVVMLDRN